MKEHARESSWRMRWTSALACAMCGMFAVGSSMMLIKRAVILDEGTSYNEILASRSDAWSGMARETNAYALLLAITACIVVAVVAIIARTRFAYVAWTIACLFVIVAIVAWFLRDTPGVACLLWIAPTN